MKASWVRAQRRRLKRTRRGRNSRAEFHGCGRWCFVCNPRGVNEMKGVQTVRDRREDERLLADAIAATELAAASADDPFAWNLSLKSMRGQLTRNP